ncbi:MAG: hypothetical protein MUE81_21120 [Thermoflexibacter sp.]|jgi:hypothetical protein|nr:hypothetical protein [Thermoflexibacter sp.]
MDIQSFEIHFETSENTTPPYSYAYILKGSIKDKLELHYHVQYTHREDLSLEEIIDEGFSPNDDLEIQGRVDIMWVEELDLLMRQTKPRQYIQQANIDFLEVNITHIDGTGNKFFPQNQDLWGYLCEELCQALLEEKQVERPLLFKFKKISPLESIEYWFMMSFSKRQVMLQNKTKKGIPKEKSVGWEYGKKFLELVFKPDYFAENAQVHEPNKNGFYINIGDELWYEAGKTALNRSQKVDVLGQIEKKVLEFFV